MNIWHDISPKTITTDKLAGTLLKGFDGQNLQYLDV